jgi:biopolymer transport protein ExbB
MAMLFCMSALVLPHVGVVAEETGPKVTVQQEDELGVESSTAGKPPETVLQLIINSGLFGWLILLLSVILLSLAIRGYMEFNPSLLLPEETLQEVEESIEQGNLEQALAISHEDESPLGRVLEVTLSTADGGLRRMEEASMEEAEAQATALHQRIGYINLIANISPMLGLLGTVSGMVSAFKMIALSPHTGPQQLAGGIYEALTTTLLGLCVAIPGTVIFTFLRNRVIKIVMDLGAMNNEVLEQFRRMGWRETGEQ